LSSFLILNDLHLQLPGGCGWISNQTMEEVAAISEKETKTNRWIDRLGVSVSVACLIHCLALPFLLAAAPGLGIAFWIGEGFDLLLAIAAVLLAVGSLCWGFRIHREKRLFVVFAAAVAFFVGGQIYAEGWLETALVMTGAFGFVGSHLLNRHLCRSCRSCETESCEN